MILWIRQNRGQLARVAQTLRCSPQFVSQVANGVRSSKNMRIERMLKEAGAPL